jgi:uncharacterized protein GlcG (DUF336 family)
MGRRFVSFLLGATAVIGPAAAQQIPGPYGEPVTLAQARQIADAAERAAGERGLRMAFTVVDPAGQPILVHVMDGTQSGSIAVSQKKARTAAQFRRTTKTFADGLAAGNLGVLTMDGVIALEGGVPILSGGRVIGALGVSGGTSPEDGQIAASALASAGLDGRKK